MMELHIYREGNANRVVKDSAKLNVLYFCHTPHLLRSFPKQVYRSSSETSQPLAAIEKDGYFNPSYILTGNPSQESIVIDPPGFFSEKSKFVFGGQEYFWKSDKELVEAASGNLVASFDRKKFSFNKKGVLTIMPAGMQMVDIVVLTALVLEYHWEERRDSSCAAAGAAC
jgi:hypothetical protein